MIRINRNKKDKHGKLIKPNNAWFLKSKDATKKSILEKENHVADPNIYCNLEVRKALEKLYNDKCAYCESKPTATSDWNVEHYRPKGEVFECQNHPGYYWLAYDWKNLFLSCTHCNQYRIDKPRWENTKAISGGKCTHFPLKYERKRAMSHKENFKIEEPLFLNPSEDYPEKHLRYDITGQIHPLRESIKGYETIRICNLKRSRLREAREEIIHALIDFLELLSKLKMERNKQAADELDQKIKKYFLDDSRIYAGIARYVYNHPDYFGI